MVLQQEMATVEDLAAVNPMLTLNLNLILNRTLNLILCLCLFFWRQCLFLKRLAAGFLCLLFWTWTLMGLSLSAEWTLRRKHSPSIPLTSP